MFGLKRIAAVAAISVAVFASGQASAEAPRPLEATLSYKMLQMEGSVRRVPKAKFDLLRSALERARYDAASQHTRPDTRREAIEVLDAIQIALAKHNFIQPTSREDWKDTIGDALEPLAISREERRRLLSPGEVNGFRARYIDPDKPLYYIDDDIGSQLIISVGQRMGWDIRLVWVDDHYFVRWYLTPKLAVNWDWTAGGPTRNEDYSIDGGAYYRDWPARQRYLKGLTSTYAHAQFLYLLARQVNGAGKRKVLELAMATEPTHEQVQNSLAWVYATEPGLGRGYARFAVQYALSAWAAMPGDPATADTVACAFAATGERALAIQLERFAIDRLRETGRGRSTSEYENRLRQIQAGGRCSPAPSSPLRPASAAPPSTRPLSAEPALMKEAPQPTSEPGPSAVPLVAPPAVAPDVPPPLPISPAFPDASSAPPMAEDGPPPRR